MPVRQVEKNGEYMKAAMEQVRVEFLEATGCEWYRGRCPGAGAGRQGALARRACRPGHWASPRLGEALGATVREVCVLSDRLDSTLWGLDGEIDHGVGPAARDPAKVRLGCCAVPGDEASLAAVARVLKRLPLRFRNLIEVEVLAGPGVRVPNACKHVKIPHKRDYPGLVRWLRRNIHWDVGILLPATGTAAQTGRPLGFAEHAALDMAIACADAGVHGVTALVVPDSDRGWFAAIRQLVGDPALRVRLARAARMEVAAAHALGDETALHADVLFRAGQAAAKSRADHCQPHPRADRDPEDASAS